MKITDVCTGCSACMNICPKGCITMKENEYGELTPSIDLINCIECGLCKKVCPQNKTAELTYPCKCYAAWDNNNDNRFTSSSGGVATCLSLKYLNEGNAVYGTSFNENNELVFKKAIDISDIEAFKGSKYTQASVGFIYKDIQTELKANKNVLFIGTPCQVSGLLSYLQKPYDNLLTIDLVCHGTPPNIYLREYISNITKDKLDKIQFRGKEDKKLILYNNGNVIYNKDKNKDDYLFAFYNNLISRDSCYTCKYGNPKRVSDLTLGDFWGLGDYNEFNYSKEKVASILVNTVKGKEFLDNCKELTFIEREVIEAIIGNAHLQYPSKYNKYRSEFRKLYKSKGFNYAIANCGIKKEMMIQKLPGRIRRLIRK